MADTPLPTSATEGTLSNWAAPYVTDYLSKGQALASQPYQAYTGPLTAGQSGLQQQAFQGLANLAVPTSVGDAAAGAGSVASQMQGMAGYAPTTGFSAGYTPPNATAGATQFTNQYAAPSAFNAGTFNAGFSSVDPTAGATQFTNQYNPAASQYGAQTIGNQYNPAAGQYQTGQFGTDSWSTAAAQQYMNPYLQTSLDPQLQESRRQADISRLADAARLTKAGAYGGSRQAVMESEGRRNLMDIQGQITGRGYDAAYQQGLGQFNTEQGRSLDAQRATEASRQFGAGQAMTAADLAARYGMDAAKFNQSERQFGSGQAMTAAELQARYGLSAQQAQEAARQFGVTQTIGQNQTAANLQMEAQRNAEQSRQFGASQGMTAAANAAQYGQSALAAQEQARQFGVAQQGQYAQQAGQFNLDAQKQAEASRQFGANYGLDALSKSLGAYGTQQQLGLAGLNAQRNVLSDQLAGGATQRDIQQQGITADMKQFDMERAYPYEMLQYQKDLMSGLPITTSLSYTASGTDPLASLLQGSAAGGNLYSQLTGTKTA